MSRWYGSVIAVVLALSLASGITRGDEDAGVSTGLACPSRPGLAAFIEGANFRVWYGDNGRATAQKLLGILQTANQKLSFLPAPVADSISCNDGGSPRIDFYLVDNPRPSFWDPKDATTSVFILPPSAGQVSGFVELNRGLSGRSLGCAAAHSYFHLMQGRYGFPNIRKNLWWYEATANYAEFTFDPQCPSPPEDADRFLQGRSHLSLELLSPYPDNYGTWLWPLYMQRKVTPGFIRTVFEKMGAAGSDATAATAGGVWEPNFPDFALRQFNKGKVDDFAKLKAANKSVRVKRIDANLDGKAVKESEYRAQVYPTATQHFLVDLLDVNTRYVTIDLSDFANEKDIHVKVLQQPTKGPSPKARADEWDDAKIDDWTGERKKHFCRDEKDQDFQQILISISNVDPDADSIRGRIKVKSEAFCQWKVTGSVVVKGSPPAATEFVSATGAYYRKTTWTLNPGEEPVICPLAKRACLPFTGNSLDAVSWKADATINSRDPFYPSTTQVHVEASGAGRYTYAEKPGAGDLPSPALFQEMVWDADAEKFRPVVSVMLSNYLLHDGQLKHRTPAPNAHWEANGSGECDRINGVPDYVYTASNVHGRVSRGWASCLEDTMAYGANKPMYFDGFALPFGATLKPGNHPGDGICDPFELFVPWKATSGGPCWRVNFDPYPTFATREIRIAGSGAPVPALASPHLDDALCSRNPDPCPVTSGELGSDHDDWPLTITVRITLRKAPNR